MKYSRIIFLIFVSLAIGYLITSSNIDGNVEIKPQINQPTNLITPALTEIQMTTGIQNQQVSPPVADASCRDGNTVLQNVKPCGPDLECYSLTPYDERFCRLPDGTCKFFCTDK